MSTEVRIIIDALNNRGVHVIADRAFDNIHFDFSEHDKKVAEEKDKRIAELEEMRNHLWKVGETQQRKRLDAEEEASELRKELIVAHKRIVELIAEKNVLKTEGCFDRISELEERHKYDCIKIKNLQAALDLITEMYELLKEVHGL